ncbi:hypothetical protein JCM10212_000919 [Sporobolomyces blumeae]
MDPVTERANGSLASSDSTRASASASTSIAIEPSPASTSDENRASASVTPAPHTNAPTAPASSTTPVPARTARAIDSNGADPAASAASSRPSSTARGTAPSNSTHEPTAAPANPAADPPRPLDEQELYAFGSTAEEEILPPPPRDPNSLANAAVAHAANAAEAVAGDVTPGGGTGPAAGTKRSLGTGATASATGPLARAKRPKNVKFTAAKTGKQLARRAAAPGGLAGDVALPNNDYCDACGGKGDFLCCDGGCLRSFHFGCLEPPLEIDEVPDESWYCKACRATIQPPPRPPRGFFSDLIYKVDTENPKAFSLSSELKTFFKNVAVGINGEFIDSNEHRPPSKITGRAIGQEDRDGYRLKDKNGRAIICYHCSEAASAARHRRVISCDFCDQHWHLDCLDPPMTGMPPPTRKWMCPLHSEHVIPKKRTPRNMTMITLDERGAPNNGDVVVLPEPERGPPEEYEEMTVNRIRYQVPEQNIILDFWGKVDGPARRAAALGTRANGGKKKKASPKKRRVSRSAMDGYESGNSSPLTDLTSSESEDAEMDEGDDDERGDRRTVKREASATARSAARTTTALDNLALLAEVRYIDLQSGSSTTADAPSAMSRDRPTAPRQSLPRPAGAPAIPSAAGSRSTLASAPLPGAAAGTTGTMASNAGSPTPSPGPGVVAGAGPGASQRRVSPSLSPAPGRPRTGTPQSELTIESKEDLKALMQVRKLLLSQGQAQGGAKTTMLSFLEGAPIIPKLAFVNNGKSSPWQRPWDAAKDGPKPPGQSTPAGATPAGPISVRSPVASGSPLPRPAPALAAQSTPVGPVASAVLQKLDGPATAAVAPPSTTPAVAAPASSTAAPATTDKSAQLETAPSSSAAAPRPAGSPLLSTANIPTPYSTDMPFQLPAFRPAPLAPAPASRPGDAMDVDSRGGTK